MKKKIYLDIVYQGKKIKGYILDISKTGIGIASSGSMKKGALLKVTSKSAGLVNLKGKVANITEMKRKSYIYKIGVKFLSLTGVQKNALNKFISGLDKRKFFRLEFV